MQGEKDKGVVKALNLAGAGSMQEGNMKLEAKEEIGRKWGRWRGKWELAGPLRLWQGSCLCLKNHGEALLFGFPLC